MAGEKGSENGDGKDEVRPLGKGLFGNGEKREGVRLERRAVRGDLQCDPSWAVLAETRRTGRSGTEGRDDLSPNPFGSPRAPTLEEEIEDARSTIRLNRLKSGFPAWRVSTRQEWIDPGKSVGWGEDHRRRIRQNLHRLAGSYEELGIVIGDPEEPMNVFLGRYEPTEEEIREAAEWIGDDPMGEEYWL